jgi:hypothetical protein
MFTLNNISMNTYTFSTNLLSAEKTGTPNLIGTSISGVAVTFLSGAGVPFNSIQASIVSLSTYDVGFAFNPTTVTVATTALSTFHLSSYPVSAVNVAGSVFNLPITLDSSDFAIIKTDASYTVFPWLSTTETIPTSALSATNQVSTPNVRRLRFLGY